MKFILLSVVCLLGATVAQPAPTKQKRDILPGDPRYGTDYHHNHHHAHEHHHESNEVEVARALGGYVGSYSVPDNSVYQNNINFQPLPTSYGPPNFTPGKPVTTTQITGAVQKTVHQHEEAPAFSEQSTISNFKTAENVETISNGYLAPVLRAAQPAPVPTHQPDQVNAQYLPPVAQKTIQQTAVETAEKPVDSYGSPVPESEYTTPEIESDEQEDVIEVKSQDTSSSDVSADVEATPAVPNEAETVEDTPVQQEVSVKAHVEADADVQPTVKTVQIQEQVNHAHHTAQPAVNHHVQKTVKSAGQPQNIFQQSVQQFPEFYAGLSSANLGGSYDGFSNFGSLNSGYQSYGVPSFGPSAASPTYDSGFGNFGYGYQHDFNSNQYSTGAIQQDSVVPQFPQISGSGQSQQFPLISNFGQNPQFPQLPGLAQNPQFPQFPGFGQNQQFPQISGSGQNSQFPQIPGLGQNQQFPQISESGQNPQFPQIPGLGQNQQFPQISGSGQNSQFPQFPGLGQNPQFPALPGFGQNQQGSNNFPRPIPNFVPTQQENNQVNVQPNQPTVSVKSGSFSVKSVNTQQVQPADVQVNTHSSASSFAKQSPSYASNGGYVY